MESSRPKVTQSSMSSASAKSGGATVYIPSPSLLLQRTQRVYSSALTATTAATSLPGEHHQLPKTSHVVKIQIPRIEHQSAPRVDGVQTSTHTKSSTRVSIVPIVVDRVPNKLSKDSQAPFQHHTDQPKITDMVQKHENPATELDVVTNSSYLYYIPNSMRSSGQCSPDTLDSGTCSDMEATPPPLPKKMSKMPVPGGSGSVSPVHQQQASSTPSGSPQPPVNGRHVRNGSVTDSEESESSLSCDSLNCGDVLVEKSDGGKMLLPDSLLKDIRKRSAEQESDVKVDFTIASMQHRDEIAADKDLDPIYDRFYKFYINEYVQDPVTEGEPKIVDTSDESFAGFRDIHSGTSTIRSAKGTIRGVKNRVRNGIVTFQQMQSNLLKVSS
uniref:Glutaredoxin domain-containing cysteine-rich protein n=2 Tax=Lutzomyia longipalpis TaxID=7200 RepID=A0A1B0GGT0_LUTLO